jgi:hypothetical protein
MKGIYQMYYLDISNNKVILYVFIYALMHDVFDYQIICVLN